MMVKEKAAVTVTAMVAVLVVVTVEAVLEVAALAAAALEVAFLAAAQVVAVLEEGSALCHQECDPNQRLGSR